MIIELRLYSTYPTVSIRADVELNRPMIGESIIIGSYEFTVEKVSHILHLDTLHVSCKTTIGYMALVAKDYKLGWHYGGDSQALKKMNAFVRGEKSLAQLGW